MLSLALMLTLTGDPALCASMAFERDPAVRASSSTDAIRRSLVELTRPLCLARDERSIEVAHDAALRAIPGVLLRLVSWALENPARASAQPGWEEALFARMATDLPCTFPLDELLARHRFVARIQSLRRDGGPQATLQRLRSMSEASLAQSLREPQERAAVSAFLTLTTLAVLQREVQSQEPWRRAWLLSRQLDGLRRQTPLGPPAPAEHVPPELIAEMIQLGLYPRLPEVAHAVDEALRQSVQPREAFEALRARHACDDTALVYFGDMPALFRWIAPVDQTLAEVRARIAARERYLTGELSIEALAAQWQASVPDALAALDAQGFARPVEAIRLSDETRRARLARIQADVAARAGALSDDPEAVRRSVVSTQRIEGVDARGHTRG